jgi:pimeloyl-ACP methyl ester carboxylesterase
MSSLGDADISSGVETYLNGSLSGLVVADRPAYVLVPHGRPTPDRRWVWITPDWLGRPGDLGVIQHRLYIEAVLSRGFHVAGVDVGVTYGSPRGAEICHEFYLEMVTAFALSDRVRLIAQSNGGLIGYAWAFRHPNVVDRIFGIFPVTDFFSWPPGGVGQIVSDAEPGMEYNLSETELRERSSEFNPIDNLAPLAGAGVKIFHVHGDSDDLVPHERNSLELQARYRALKGDCEVEVLPGIAHGGRAVFESMRAVQFLLQ